MLEKLTSLIEEVATAHKQAEGDRQSQDELGRCLMRLEQAKTQIEIQKTRLATTPAKSTKAKTA